VKLTSIPRSRLLGALATAAGLVLCVRCGLGGDGLLCLAPVLLLAATLFARRYPGERLLAALADRRQSRQLRPRASRRSPRRPDVRVPRGGLLMAFALAVRPPPAALLAS
jgi:hypothetical protein